MSFSVQLFALLAALLHVFIFCLESLWFMKPEVYKRFGARSLQEAQALRLFALNQGFYNLFLAIGIFIGLGFYTLAGDTQIAQALILFCCGCMAFAAVH